MSIPHYEEPLNDLPPGEYSEVPPGLMEQIAKLPGQVARARAAAGNDEGITLQSVDGKEYLYAPDSDDLEMSEAGTFVSRTMGRVQAGTDKIKHEVKEHKVITAVVTFTGAAILAGAIGNVRRHRIKK